MPFGRTPCQMAIDAEEDPLQTTIWQTPGCAPSCGRSLCQVQVSSTSSVSTMAPEDEDELQNLPSLVRTGASFSLHDLALDDDEDDEWVCVEEQVLLDERAPCSDVPAAQQADGDSCFDLIDDSESVDTAASPSDLVPTGSADHICAEDDTVLAFSRRITVRFSDDIEMFEVLVGDDCTLFPVIKNQSAAAERMARKASGATEPPEDCCFVIINHGLRLMFG